MMHIKLSTQLTSTAICKFDDQIFRGLFRTTGMIRQIMIPFFEEHGISVAQWVILRILYEREQTTKEPMRMVDLSQYLCIRQPSLTSLINRLDLQRLIQRSPSSGEKRGRRIGLTPKGRSLIKSLLGPHSEIVSDLLNVFTLPQKKQFVELIEILKEHVEMAARFATETTVGRNSNISKSQGNG